MLNKLIAEGLKIQINQNDALEVVASDMAERYKKLCNDFQERIRSLHKDVEFRKRVKADVEKITGLKFPGRNFTFSSSSYSSKENIIYITNVTFYKKETDEIGTIKVYVDLKYDLPDNLSEIKKQIDQIAATFALDDKPFSKTIEDWIFKKLKTSMTRKIIEKSMPEVTSLIKSLEPTETKKSK